MSRWWRAHASSLDDPKVQRLPGDLFKAWFNLLCVACVNDGILPPLGDIAFALRVSESEADKIIKALIAAKLIDETEAGLSPHNWNGRQYKSDVSTERVQQFRERQRNVSETPSEADTEQNRTERIDRAPARKTALPADWKPSDDQLAYAKAQGIGEPSEVAESFRLYHASKGTTHKDWDLAFKYWCRNDKRFRKPANGFTKPEPRTADMNSPDQWSVRLRGYKPGGVWSPMWGPRPESGQCWAPKELLASMAQ